MLSFRPITEYQPGILLNMLVRSYASFAESEPDIVAGWQEDWKAVDELAFAYPDTIGCCFFISTLDGEPVGFASYDPRQAPEVGIVGHNCIVPEYRGRGFGKLQVAEILRHFKHREILKAVVSTCDQPCFIPAQRQYLANGFEEERRFSDHAFPGGKMIEYWKFI